ncbi:hypothetical protein B9Z65_5269 [Elsinoe australis]|uniref:PNPLA domain-containing protein n=1 Tax=Elsinoe australis TaxID=40998 RepID=A0A2P7ZDQ1_9PEZI|nr:hypothetical protein B9Z65_5269 [Elsinoe australis]
MSGTTPENAASPRMDLSHSARLRPSPGASPHGSQTSSPAPSIGRSPVRGDVTTRDWGEARRWMRDVRDPWDPCILTLDGGGIRGFSSALVLKRLMEEIYAVELEYEEDEPTGELPSSQDDLLPCHYFDFMYGTSTGGLIAVMLARLRMTIKECLDQYRKVGDELFGHRKNIVPFMTKYRSEPLEKAVKELVAKRNLGQMHPWHAEFRRDSVHDHDDTDPRSHVDSVFLPHLTSEPDRIPRLSRSTLADHTSSATRNDSADSKPAVKPATTPTSNHASPQAVLPAIPPHTPFPSDGRSPGSSTRYTASTTDSESPRWDPNAPRVCQSCCLTAIHNGTVQKAHLLRSYPHKYTRDLPAWITPYNSGADLLHIWQVTRATSAAPFYFDMLEAIVDNERRGHKDGGIRENNPSGAALSEFVSLYPRKEKPALMLSIGTGRTNTSPDGFMSALPWPFGHFTILRKMAENISVIPHLLVKYTESEAKHEEMVRYAKGENTWYKRLNVSEGLENMPLDDWTQGKYHGQNVPGGASLTRMEEATNGYLDREVNVDIEKFVAPKEMIKHTAEKLVRVRRARRRMGGDRWETYIGGGLREQMIRQTITEDQAHAGAHQ